MKENMNKNMKKNMKKNMNKKVITPLMVILGIGLVIAAGATYYALATYTINVNQPISVIGDGDQTVPTCDAGDTCLSDNPIVITNTDDEERTVNAVKTYGTDDIVVSYVGKMTFAGKNLETGVVLASTEEIVYSVTGDSFVATGIPTTHKLVYYPDMVGGFAENVQHILVYDEDTFPSLPVLADIGDNYCTIMTGDNSKLANPDVDVCNGAKLWLVENAYVTALRAGTSWEPDKILFETDLMTYTVSSDGEVLVPAKSTITIYPAFTTNEYATGGDETIQVTVA